MCFDPSYVGVRVRSAVFLRTANHQESSRVEPMPKEIPLGLPVELIQKWLALAERRKSHLIELYESGRWRLYYTDADLVERLREAIRGVDRWSATQRAVADRTACGGGE